MTYCALARTWRPKKFSDFIGQEHAVSALQHTLTEKKIHHAYLFTGTRGVGKTSIARLFAKSLSCQQGIQAEPCGVCKHCEAIKQGRFLDLIEIDAASRTKVEDTRELLAQVSYPPVQGRFKIYLIDEVHMLSTHSFNALLKTLEEPPQHVKFLLATTDPQKLPITIQSRCLQFHLQHLPPNVISKQLSTILEAQGTHYEDEALKVLAQHAQGSMRDAISLLEQALSSCADLLDLESVSQMLGTLPTDKLYQLLTVIAKNDKSGVSSLLDQLQSQSYDYISIIDQCINTMCQITQLQLRETSTVQNSATDKDTPLDQLAALIPSEQVQMHLNLLVDTKKNLQFYPDHNMAFATLVMRLMCFTTSTVSIDDLIKKHIPTEEPRAIQPNQKPVLPIENASQKSLAARDIITPQPTPTPEQKKNASASPQAIPQNSPSASHAAPKKPLQIPTSWDDLKKNIELSGFQKQVFGQCTLNSDFNDSNWTICIPSQYQIMLHDSAKKSLGQTIKATLGRDISIVFSVQNTATQKGSVNADPSTKNHSVQKPTSEDTSIQQDDPKLQKLLQTLDAHIGQDA